MKTRRAITLILTLCLFLAVPIAAHADVMYEPQNDFYAQNKDQIVPLGQYFSVEGETGHVRVMNAPGSDRENGRIPNTIDIYVHYTCLCNNAYWGYTELAYGLNAVEGWVRMDQLQPADGDVWVPEALHINITNTQQEEQAEDDAANSTAAFFVIMVVPIMAAICVAVLKKVFVKAKKTGNQEY